MHKKIALIIFILSLALVAQTVVAKNNGDRSRNAFLPDHAVQVSGNVFSLGSVVDELHGVVEGYAIVHKRRGHAKPDGTPGGGKGGGGKDKGGSSSCYGFLAKDAKWKTVEPWVVNTWNPDGISSTSVFGILDGGISKWESAAGGVDILGVGSATTDLLEADWNALDETNEVYFDDLGNDGTIGVTVVWGIFGGPPRGRELVGWDQVYNTVYPWSDSGEALKMDLDNIGTHELGHSVGLGDLYDVACLDETMYGYADYGETNKRDLNAGDIEGINKLY